jgi:hypothetical protein
MFFRRIIFIFILFFLQLEAHAGEPVSRRLLAVVDGDELTHESFNLIAQDAETPLGHLGYLLDYVDVSQHLPTDAEMAPYAGVVSWFTDNKLRGASAYAAWLTRQLERGKRALILGGFGCAFDENMNPTPAAVTSRLHAAFGISVDESASTDSPLLIDIASNDPAMTEFERTLAGELTDFVQIRPLGNGSHTYLRLRRRDTGAVGDAVFTTPRGGFVLSGYAIYLNPEDKSSRWRINPFAFFRAALGTSFPAPDITTVNGMRLFMSHIDGDGIRNISEIDGKTPSGELAYRRILTHYTLPVTTSIVIGDLIQAGRDERAALYDTIRRTFALPNVEPASHGWAHPMIWAKAHRKLAFDLPGYVYSPANEIGASLAFINQYLVPPEKKAEIFLWTGDCRPDAEALAYVWANGIGNLNGGDTRMDGAYPTYTKVAPLFRHVDGELQNFAADANEVQLTNIWTGPFYGYRFIIETFQHTESPIRLRPIDVYYHYYVMEKNVSARALEEVYDWAMAQEIAPVFLSGYLAKLEGFQRTRIERLGSERWAVAENGALRTVRLDGITGGVDLARSKGVIGFVSYQGSLYVHLDNGERSEIQLTRNPPARPYLTKANGEVENVLSQADGVSFDLRAMGRAAAVIGGCTPGRVYTVNVDGVPVGVTADERGMISFSRGLAGSGFKRVAVIIRGQ